MSSASPTNDAEKNKNEIQDVSLMMSPDQSDDESVEVEDIENVEIIQWLPYLLKHIFIMTVGGGILALPVIILTATGEVDFIRALKQEDPEDAPRLIYNTTRFFSWATGMLIIITFVSYIVSTLPRIIIRITSLIAIGKIEAVKQYLEFYTALTTTIKVALSVSIAFGLWCLTFPKSIEWDPQKSVDSWKVIAFRILFCIFIGTLIISLEKIIVQLIAIRFHRTAYKHRLADAKYATYVLDNLNKARKKHGSQPYIRKSGFITESSSQQAHPIPKHIKDTSASTPNSSFVQTPKSRPTSAAGQPYRGIFNNINKTVFEGRYEDDVDLNSKNEARKLARKIFSSLQGQRKYILVDDLYPLFPNKEEAKKAFDFFDKDGNGDISRREMRDQITQIYKERKDLTLALRDTSQAVGKLDTILLIIFLVFTGFTWSVVFGKDLYATLIPFGTFFLGLSFIFGESAKELFQSIIFLFVMHPYDAGDRVYIEKDNLLVQKVGLLGTQFTHVNGQETYIPHSILMKKVIYNIRRSTSQAEQIDFQIDFDTPKEKIIALKEGLNRYLTEEESREFHADVLLALSEIVDSNKLNMFVWLEYKGNWQDGGRRWARKTRFMIALREICHELDLGYTLLPQKIEHINPPPYMQPQRPLQAPIGQ